MGTTKTAGEHKTLSTVEHRPFPLPDRPWIMTQRWNDLLFAHWPIAAGQLTGLIPPDLELDLFDHYAWIGVVPFWMDRIRYRTPGTVNRSVPFSRSFPELNLRTYVRSKRTGRPGVFFFSLDAASPLAVAGARILFHLPYFLANMQRETSANGTVRYKSLRLLSSKKAAFQASYRGFGQHPRSAASQPGSVEYFLTERYCLFTTAGSRLLVGDIHHLPWALEPAEAEIRVNDLPRTKSLMLSSAPPLLHFSKSLDVFIWPLRPESAV